MKIKDKRAGEKVLSIWWFFVLAVIGLGIVIGVLTYYEAEVNVKLVEADVLSEKILNCIIETGYLKEFLNSDFDVFKQCGLNEKIFEKGSYFYFNISIYDDQLLKNITAGDSSLVADCYVWLESKKLEARYFPRCVRKKENALYFNRTDIKNIKIEILTISNQEGNKISI